MLISSRPGGTRAATVQWLEQQAIGYDSLRLVQRGLQWSLARTDVLVEDDADLLDGYVSTERSIDS